MSGVSEIILPDSTKTYQCLVPGCTEQHWLNFAAYQRHVAECARKHRSSLIDESDRHKAEVDDDPFARVWDPEALEWVQKNIRDGKPGFG